MCEAGLKILPVLAALALITGCAATRQASPTPDANPGYLPLDLEVALALAAGPPHVRSEATVYVFGESGYRQVRSGTNGVTCLVNRDGHQDGDKVLRPTCWDAEGSETIVPVVLRVGTLIAQGATAEEISQDVEQGFISGRFLSPRRTGIAYMLKGDVIIDGNGRTVAETVFPPHYMIYAPGVSNADIAITENAFQQDPSLPIVFDGYSGGSRTAYIIIVAAGGVAHIHD